MMRRLFRRPANRWQWAAFVLALCLLAGAAITVWWLGRYTVAVSRLRRGVGDTVFYAADGKPWFRLDEQRHDVPLADIAPDMQHAVIAIEDHRFSYHPGIDPIGLARAVVRDIRGGDRADARSPALEVRHPRAVPESRLPQRRCLRRRDDVAASLPQAGEGPHPRRGVVDRRVAALAL